MKITNWAKFTRELVNASHVGYKDMWFRFYQKKKPLIVFNHEWKRRFIFFSKHLHFVKVYFYFLFYIEHFFQTIFFWTKVNMQIKTCFTQIERSVCVCVYVRVCVCVGRKVNVRLDKTKFVQLNYVLWFRITLHYIHTHMYMYKYAFR